MVCDTGLRDMIAHPGLSLLQASPRARLIPNMLEIRPGKKKRGADRRLPYRCKWYRPKYCLKNQARARLRLHGKHGQRRSDGVESFVISGAGVFKINRAILSIVGQRLSLGKSAHRGSFSSLGQQVADRKQRAPFDHEN
jgi:hypothetical protein